MQFKKLTLLTANLAAQHHFYNQILGCPIHSEAATSFTLQIGQTTLQFKSSPIAKPYHFAINIPAFQENEAFAWLQKRVTILPFQEKEIVDFKNWNAKAIYFYDADKNIVELIARRNLKQIGTLPFSANSFLEISEIGMPIVDIATTFKKLQHHLGVSIFDGNFDKFCAVGGEQGLFILINKNKKDWFPLNDKAFCADFELQVNWLNQQKVVHFRKGQLEFTRL